MISLINHKGSLEPITVYYFKKITFETLLKYVL